MIGGGRGCKVGSAPDLAGGGGWQPPPVQGEYLNSTFDFLDDVLIFEKILQGPGATESANPARSGALPNRQSLQGPERDATESETAHHHMGNGNFASWVCQHMRLSKPKVTKVIE